MPTAKFITVHCERDKLYTNRSAILHLNVNHIKCISTLAAAENCYCVIDGVTVLESYNEVIYMLKDTHDAPITP